MNRYDVALGKKPPPEPKSRAASKYSKYREMKMDPLVAKTIDQSVDLSVQWERLIEQATLSTATGAALDRLARTAGTERVIYGQGGVAAETDRSLRRRVLNTINRGTTIRDPISIRSCGTCAEFGAACEFANPDRRGCPNWVESF